MPSNCYNVFQTFYIQFPLPEFILCMHFYRARKRKWKMYSQYHSNMQFVVFLVPFPCSVAVKLIEYMEMNLNFLFTAQASHRYWQHCLRLWITITIRNNNNLTTESKTEHTEIDNTNPLFGFVVRMVLFIFMYKSNYHEMVF